MDTTQALHERAERGAARGADQVWAAATMGLGYEAGPHRRMPRGGLGAAAGLVLLALGGYFVLRARDGGPELVMAVAPESADESARVAEVPTPPVLADAVASLPGGFSWADAPAVFAAGGDADTVAAAYLAERFIEPVRPELVDAESVAWGAIEARRWRFPPEPGTDLAESGGSGWVFLRPTSTGYEVAAATTDGVDTSGVRVGDGHVVGVVETSSIESLFADVLDVDGTPLSTAPRPDGYAPDAPINIGTAAGPSDTRLSLDVEVPTDRVLLRVNLVGGSILSVTEHAVPVGPVAAVVEPPSEDVTPETEAVVLVPHVIERMVDSARLTLEQQGFTVEVVFELVEPGSPDVGRVLAQVPEPGAEVAPGTTVTVVTGEVGASASTTVPLFEIGVRMQLELDEIVLQACDGPVPPFKSGDVAEPELAASPQDAVLASVRAWEASDDQPNNMPVAGWYEITLPDGRLAFGWNADPAITSPDSFNIVLWLEQTDDGSWAVVSWESSGC